MVSRIGITEPILINRPWPPVTAVQSHHMPGLFHCHITQLVYIRLCLDRCCVLRGARAHAAAGATTVVLLAPTTPNGAWRSLGQTPSDDDQTTPPPTLANRDWLPSQGSDQRAKRRRFCQDMQSYAGPVSGPALHRRETLHLQKPVFASPHLGVEPSLLTCTTFCRGTRLSSRTQQT